MIRSIFLLMLALASWGAWAEPSADTAASPEPRDIVLSSAESMVGMRYRLGGNAVSAIDCSGMVRAAFTRVGIELPRSTQEQIKLGRKIDARNVRPGDLMFYRWGKRRLHVAVYAGDGEILHASPSAGQVTRTLLTADWNRRLVQVRRLL